MCYCAILAGWATTFKLFLKNTRMNVLEPAKCVQWQAKNKKHVLFKAYCNFVSNNNCLQKCHLAFSSTCSITTRFCSTFTSSFMSVPPKIMPKGTWVSGVKVRQNKQKDVTLLGHTEANLRLYDYDTNGNDWRYEYRKTHHIKGKMFTQEKPPGPEKMNGQRSLKCMFLR